MKQLLLTFATIALCCGFLSAQNRIIISKKDFKLYVFNQNDSVIFVTDVCLGENIGNKTRNGDHKTPEGKFTIMSIENSSAWKDFDGKFRASYGPWFMRLKMPRFRSIGIHGTNEPESIGTRASMGCVRLHNEELVRLKELVRVGTPVEILAEEEQFAIPPTSSDK
ncbi:MAG: L,D-transpeptidase [Paramuribaculum sp.]|nr:L,D-transpeptidase [Paramuribaculum sp.]MDE6322575.1 L,D-transpeptidase [Paramuribaculum sp.]MDE6488688.1 L,D-transpeptidase [Paramuribaculum sp.]